MASRGKSAKEVQGEAQRALRYHQRQRSPWRRGLRVFIWTITAIALLAMGSGGALFTMHLVGGSSFAGAFQMTLDDFYSIWSAWRS